MNITSQVIEGVFRRAGQYATLGKRALDLLAGSSYWHGDQPPGRVFVAGCLEGYFNDLTCKTEWSGPTNADGLPLNTTQEGGLFVFPTTAIQKGLGHWDRWLLSGRSAAYHADAVKATAAWLLAHQDSAGGWPLWEKLGLVLDSPYSAMTQGEGISLLVRAHRMTGVDKYLQAAQLASDLMLTPVHDGGTAWYDPPGLVLDEYPSIAQRNIVLNGWIFSVFGLYDLCIATGDQNIRHKLISSVEALVSSLPRYDAKYWSYYDENGSIASPFYHQLHISQLEVLRLAFPDYVSEMDNMIKSFVMYKNSNTRKYISIVKKGFQKLANPPAVMLK